MKSIITSVARVTCMVLLIMLIEASAQSVRPKPLYKVTRLSLTEVGISCPGNGADPTGTKVGDTVIISCGH